MRRRGHVPVIALAATVVALTSLAAMQASLAKERGPMHPRITEARARAIALKRVPGAEVKSEELERERGHLIYSYDLRVPGRRGIVEVNVDALTGQIVAVSHETPASERKE